MSRKKLNINKKVILLILIMISIFFLSVVNIKSILLPSVDKSLLSENGNFVLYVSNQSFEINKVDIQVRIDDKVAVSQYFEVENQHNSKKFILSLPKGKHTLKVYSSQEKISLRETFTISDKHWAVIDFWYYPKGHYNPTPKKHFTFNIQNEPIYFK
ncbi:MAG: hypothetical protein JXA96_00585 [Sedimentisphaerales bacterium]|nr:hypothetical protein [Sedimentisphaerales bacterium]